MTFVDELGLSLIEAFTRVSAGVVVLLPRILLALVIFIIGWIFGVTIGRFISQIVSALQIDRALSGVGVEGVLTKAGFRLHTGNFFGAIIKWFIIIVFLIAAFEILGLNELNTFLRETVLGYLPDVIVAAIILVIAAVISEALQKVVVGSAKAAELPSANLLGGITKWAIWIFAIIAALNHLGVATALLDTLFTGLVYMLTIAGGLAFGLGGKEAAARFIERLHGDISEKHRR